MRIDTLEIDKFTAAQWDQLTPVAKRMYQPIPLEQEEAVRGMNRKQRRAWLAQQRRGGR